MNKTENINKLNTEIKSCIKCDLWKNKKNYVIGNGSLDSNIFLLGKLQVIMRILKVFHLLEGLEKF